MAGSIPTFVSSSPPPLCGFDDDEEEDDDEFGVYAVAEELDYNECISYGGKDEGKQGGDKSRGEQDSTSQDSATDSGLCPDSEGMSPTPHSDDERQRVDGQLHNGHPEPADDATPTESSDYQLLPVVQAKLGDLTAPQSQVCDGVTPTVDETLNNHDTKLFNQFQDSSGEGCVTPPVTELKPTLENINSFKDVTGSVGSSKNVILLERDNHKSVTLINEDDDNFDDFQEFSENSIIHKPLSDVCIEDASLQDFKECTVTESVNMSRESNPSKTNSEKQSSVSSEMQSLEQQNKDVIIEKLCFNNNEKSTFGNEEGKDVYKVDSLKVEDEDDDFSDFTDFKTNSSTFNEIPETEGSHSLSDQPKLVSESKDKSDEAEQSLQIAQQDESEDEFSNFADFSSSSCAFVSAQSSNSVESNSHIPSKPCDDTDLRTDSEFQDWVSVFPASAEDCPAPASALLDPEDPVWVRLVLPEASPALSFQWAACSAHSHLLAALNIDSRNILWNCGVPRFAATLSRGPLQPVKAADTVPLQPTAAPAPQPPPSPASASVTLESVPDAHFDWGSSGLTNPLDYPKPVLNLPKTLSAEAEAILGSLRDLSFIRKNYILFPINET